MNISIPINPEVLRQLRLDKQVNQLDVEIACKIPRGKLTQFETNRIDPTLNVIKALANYYEVKPVSLISKEGLSWILTIQYELSEVTNNTMQIA